MYCYQMKKGKNRFEEKRNRYTRKRRGEMSAEMEKRKIQHDTHIDPGIIILLLGEPGTN